MSDAEQNRPKTGDAEIVKRVVGFSLIGYAAIVGVATGLSLASSEETPANDYSVTHSTELHSGYDETNEGQGSPLTPLAFSLSFAALGTYLAFPPKSHPKQPTNHNRIDPSIRHLDFKTPKVEPFYDAD